MATVSKNLGRKTKRNIPGWNEFVVDNHTLLYGIYALWVFVSKPPDGYIYQQLRLARSRFKYALRYCLRHLRELRANSLADKLMLNPCSMAAFWKEVKRLNSNPPLVHSINGISGEANIANMWKNHFADILNSVVNDDQKDFVLEPFSKISDKFDSFSVTEAAKSIEELSSGMGGAFLDKVGGAKCHAC